MIKTAVTADASAAPSIEEALETGFLPEDREYRMTGKMPDKSADTQDASAASDEEDEVVVDDKINDKSADTQDASAASAQDADTAAASAAATTQEKKGPAQSKTSVTTETRWQKITRENKELREKNARLEGRAEATTVRDTPREIPQATTPTAADGKAKGRPEPQVDDVDAKTGKVKYTSWEEFNRDQRAWDREQVKLELAESASQSQQEQVRNQAERAIAENLGKKFDTARAKHDDFDEVALNPALVLPRGSVTDMFLQDSEHGGEVVYHLGQHPEILQGFYKDHDPKTGKFVNLITPQRQFRKLLEIEAEVSGEGRAAPAKPITQAPRPPHQTSGKGSVAKDATEQALEDSDTDSYMREANSRDPRLLAARAARKKG